MNVTDIITGKGSEVISLPPSASISELIELLTGRQIGAVLIMEDGGLTGIVSERDIVRFVRDAGDLATPVSAIMSTKVWTCKTVDELPELAQKMTVNRIRHLPVLDEDDHVVAMVSIGDVVKARLDDLEAERDHLERYLHG